MISKTAARADQRRKKPCGRRSAAAIPGWPAHVGSSGAVNLRLWNFQFF